MCDINDLDISDAYNLIIESETIDWYYRIKTKQKKNG